ncbi:LeoA/HP0731 family dynamin-like GTPase [Helicobacter sp. 11S02629-2]|uniref:LeoA/HP0731 family dynamin-like GTPase n=1 Tax=Helicobacter sp. 11S02629-2 TaxID=1476195 RepID=UPI000BA64429|nr:LeoA/HP0731 family dynamin-like GTPase [Helicobacter sp. 11S02629-2]PAF45524.1 hypothetical protein BKH40_03425 [Helicobacter sp. 11S02629-2]
MDNSTVKEFEKSKETTLKLLEKLKVFLDVGKDAGVDIDPSLNKKLEDAINKIGTTKLKVALIGGFSEGKTSIAAGWLGKIEANMNISQQESSNAVVEYNIDDKIDLVDTPGLFGFKEKNIGAEKEEAYKDITRKYISEAHLVLYVMNSVNPIKESHKDELNWLFRTLNLLPRTVFILSKFDEVADPADEEDYKEVFKIKKDNVIGRLKDLIRLDSKEEGELSIVALSANPYGKGTAYWLSHMEEYKKLSYIDELQKDTTEKIRLNGGASAIADEVKKTIISDILTKQLPLAKKATLELQPQLKMLNDSLKSNDTQLKEIERDVEQAIIDLQKFVQHYFTDLILQLNGTDIQSFEEFFQREIGKDGINIETTIQIKYKERLRVIGDELMVLKNSVDGDVKAYDSTMLMLAKDGVNYLSKSGMITSKSILAARDFLGISFKFKPWGAVKLANGLGAALGFVSLAMEGLNLYLDKKSQDDFEKAKSKLKEDLESSKEELLKNLGNKKQFDEHFPDLISIKETIRELKNALDEKNAHSVGLDKWLKEGEAIEAEFEEISHIEYKP